MANPTVTILPFIEENKTTYTKSTNANASLNATVPSAVTNSNASFSEQLESAKRATAALAIDALVLASEKRAVDPVEVQQFFNSKNINIRISTAQAPANNYTIKETAMSNASKAPTNVISAYESNPVVNSEKDSLKCSDELEEYFKEASELYGVDIKFLKSVAKIESNFNPASTSSVGAMGIMQLMPATAKELDISEPYNPRQNILGGAKLLAKFLDKYNGNKELTLAAYNSGPGNVAKHNNQVPPAVQRYVDKVLGYYYS